MLFKKGEKAAEGCIKRVKVCFHIFQNTFLHVLKYVFTLIKKNKKNKTKLFLGKNCQKVVE